MAALAAVVGSLLVGANVLAVVFALLAAASLAPALLPRIATELSCRRALSHPHAPPRIALADQLAFLGISELGPRLEAAAPGGEELLLATFDHYDRLRADHPLLAGSSLDQVGDADFVERARNRLEIVLAEGVLAVRKTHAEARFFKAEVAALMRLSDVAAVPDIVRVRAESMEVVSTFMPGRNLAAVLLEAGLSVGGEQKAVFGNYPGPGRWTDGDAPPERELAVRILRDSFGPELPGRIRAIVDRAHRRCVFVRDVKYGNVAVWGDEVFLFDFDNSVVLPPPRILWRTRFAVERDLCDFTFGTGGRPA